MIEEDLWESWESSYLSDISRANAMRRYWHEERPQAPPRLHGFRRPVLSNPPRQRLRSKPQKLWPQANGSAEASVMLWPARSRPQNGVARRRKRIRRIRATPEWGRATPQREAEGPR